MASRYEEDVLRSLRRVVRAIDLHSRKLVSEFGLTTPQLVCLREIAETDCIGPSELARLVDLSQATVTGIVDRLLKRGLVTRERSQEDRRRVIIVVTRKGSKLVSAAPSPLQEQFARRLEQLPLENQQIVNTVLSQVVSMMGAEDVDAAPMLASGPPSASAQETGSFLDTDDAASES